MSTSAGRYTVEVLHVVRGVINMVPFSLFLWCSRNSVYRNCRRAPQMKKPIQPMKAGWAGVLNAYFNTSGGVSSGSGGANDATLTCVCVSAMPKLNSVR